VGDDGGVVGVFVVVGYDRVGLLHDWFLVGVGYVGY